MMIHEGEHNYRNVEGITPEKVPFELLTPRQRELLQYVSEGYKEGNIAEFMNISTRTVEATKVQMSLIGYPTDLSKHFDYTDVSTKQILSSLIQDGINNDYLTHSLPKNIEVKALSSGETKVMEDIINGMSNKEIAHTNLLALKTVESKISRIYQKMGMERNSRYLAISRYTYLVKNGCYQQPRSE